MKLTQNIAFDFAAPGITPRVYAMQGDRGSRAVTAAIYDHGAAWDVQSVVAVQYRIPSGATGLYDQIDGESAITVDGNQITAKLAEQMLVEPGVVHCELLLTDAESSITTWPFLVLVQEASTNGTEIPEDYYNAFLDVASSALESVSKAEAAAARAEAAAGSTDPDNQMSKTMYDPDGAVETAGGIPKYISAAAFVPTSQKGIANGVASLNSLGKVPTSQLPDMEEDTSRYNPTLSVSCSQASSVSISGCNYFRAGKIAILYGVLSLTVSTSTKTLNVILDDLPNTVAVSAPALATPGYINTTASTSIDYIQAETNSGKLKININLASSISSGSKFSTLQFAVIYGLS